MAMTRVTAGNEASIDDLNQLIDLLQGTSGFTESFLLRCAASSDFKIRLADAAGARRFEIQDSAGTAVAYIDSDGNLTVGGFVLPTSAAPAQTTEGSLAWDSDDDRLTVGTGSATKVIGLSRGAGLSASATQELAYDTTAAQLNVWNGSSSVSAAPAFFDSERTAFRANRRRVAEWAGQAGASNIGFGSISGGDSFTAITGEPIFLKTSTGTFRITGQNGVAALSPSHSVRMLARVQFPATSANNTFVNLGFFDTPSATATGAYLRIVTTGNVFFVTRQGGAETTTDLGALSRTTILGFEIETADAGVTWVCRNQAGTALATHTTNVPTAATGLNYGFESSIASAGVSHGIAYMLFEGTFA